MERRGVTDPRQNMDLTRERYQALRAEAAEKGEEEQDYWALDQGQYNTARRHARVLDLVQFDQKAVLDIGCGTGLILDMVAASGQVPLSWTGVDWTTEGREDRFLRRAEKAGIQDSKFLVKPLDVRFEELDLTADVGLFIGIFGYPGYCTFRQLRSMMRWLTAHTHHGVASMPRPYDANLGDGHLYRFDPGDVEDALGWPSTRLELLDKELLLWW